MDFLRIIRSLEELLYEVMTWLVFYPRTLWRIVATPGRMMRYSDAEQADAPDKQYTDTLSPPLFLMLTILIGHGVALGLGTEAPEATTKVGKALFDSEQNRLIAGSLWSACSRCWARPRPSRGGASSSTDRRCAGRSTASAT